MTRAHLLLSSLFGTALLAFSAGSHAQSLAGFNRLPVPAALKVAQRLEGAPPRGWTALKDPQLASQLDSVQIYDGHPSELATLVPDSERGMKKDQLGVYDVWTVDGTQRATWLVAGYTSTNITLGYELPRPTKEVRVYYNRADRSVKAVFHR